VPPLGEVDEVGHDRRRHQTDDHERQHTGRQEVAEHLAERERGAGRNHDLQPGVEVRVGEVDHGFAVAGHADAGDGHVGRAALHRVEDFAHRLVFDPLVGQPQPPGHLGPHVDAVAGRRVARGEDEGGQRLGGHAQGVAALGLGRGGPERKGDGDEQRRRDEGTEEGATFDHDDSMTGRAASL